MTVYQVEPIDVLMLSIVVLFLGLYLNRKIGFLRDNYIPPAVTGGLICSTIVLLLRLVADLEISFDLQMRDELLLVFFSTVGLSAKMRTLLAGGKALVLLVALAAVFLILQNTIGVELALLFGINPGYGLMGGSISFAGGHGTAIAWGQEAEAAGLIGASEIGIAFATFGLIAGGLIGGPIARYLIGKHDLSGPDAANLVEEKTDDDDSDPAELFQILTAILVLAICVEVGSIFGRALFDRGVLLPGFLTAMFVGIVITNLADVTKTRINAKTIDKMGEVSLNIFLAMSLMSMQLWSLAGAFGPIIIVLACQTLAMVAFAIFVIFWVMGRDYDASVIASGFAGLGLGATPVAIANMDAVTRRFGPSTKAFLIVPLVGAFFVDILNAATIKGFIGIITRWFL